MKFCSPDLCGDRHVLRGGAVVDEPDASDHRERQQLEEDGVRAEAITHEDRDDDGDIEENEGRGVEESLSEAFVFSGEDIVDLAEECLLRIIRAEDRRARHR